VTDSHQHTARRRLGRSLAAIAALTLASVSFAGVGAASAPDRRPAQAGDQVINFSLESETDTANGFCLTRSQLAVSGIQVVRAVYDTLTVPNHKGEYVPYLAESVEPNDDFTQWTIKVREGVTFHDDTPLNAEAVKLNLDTFAGLPGLDNAGVLFPSILTFYEGTEVVDDLTVTVTLNEPVPQYPAFLYGTGRVGIMAPAQLNSGDACATDMIGTGPFVCNDGCWTPGENMVLDANPTYWQKGFPKADQLIFTPVPETSQRLTALRGGELDIISLDNGQDIVQLDKLRNDFNVMVEQPAYREIRYYFMNASAAPFDNPDARLAVAMALDRQKIDQIIHKGFFQLASGVMDLKAPGYLKDAGVPERNVKKAAELVEQVKADGDGTFDVLLLADTSDPSNVRESQLIQEQLEAVGITVTLPPTAGQASFINDAVAGNFGLFLWRNLHGGSAADIDPDLFPWFGQTSLVNFGHIQDDELEAQLQAGRAAADINERSEAYQEVNRIISENVYILPMWYVDWTMGWTKDLSIKAPALPDGGGKPLFNYGHIPVLGLTKK
jgi:peptide/nickel transport system substrate-binding protein